MALSDVSEEEERFAINSTASKPNNLRRIRGVDFTADKADTPVSLRGLDNWLKKIAIDNGIIVQQQHVVTTFCYRLRHQLIGRAAEA
jgi:hypothetical protein